MMNENDKNMIRGLIGAAVLVGVFLLAHSLAG